jgi:tetratricopeptide (TPR) repeat protein
LPRRWNSPSKSTTTKRRCTASLIKPTPPPCGGPGAEADFAAANAFENRIDPDGDDLFSRRGIFWAEHLLRTGAEEQARRLTEANRKICERNHWQDDAGRCAWILGWLSVRAGRWDEARTSLEQAQATFTRAHMIYELARVLLTEAASHLGQGQEEAALAACERALQLAAPRKYRLVQADALNLRARLWLQGSDPDPARARDDAEAALQLAELCGYAWAEREALELLAQAYRQLGPPEMAARCQQRADEWDRRLTPPRSGVRRVLGSLSKRLLRGG